MKKGTKITILFPCLNEEKTIEASINDAKENMKKINMNNYEILVVDNGSTDNSVNIAKKLGLYRQNYCGCKFAKEY